MWRGVVWCCVVWCGVVWCGVVFSAFKRKRLFDHASKGEDLPKDSAWKEWKELPDEERKRYKREAEEQRRAADAAALEEARNDEAKSAASVVLQKLKEQASRKPTVAETRERIKQGAAVPSVQKRKGKKVEPEAMPAPPYHTIPHHAPPQTKH